MCCIWRRSCSYCHWAETSRVSIRRRRVRKDRRVLQDRGPQQRPKFVFGIVPKAKFPNYTILDQFRLVKKCGTFHKTVQSLWSEVQSPVFTVDSGLWTLDSGPKNVGRATFWICANRELGLPKSGVGSTRNASWVY